MAAGWSTAVRRRIRLCESVRYTDINRINGVPSPMGAAATVRGAIAERWRLLVEDGAASLVQLGNLAIRHRVSIHAGNPLQAGNKAPRRGARAI